MAKKAKLYVIVLGIIVFFSSCITPSVLTTNELQLGNSYINKNDFENSIKHYQNYLLQCKAFGKFRNFEAEADVNRKIAYAFSTSGKYDKTIFHLYEALHLDSTDNNSVAFSEDIRLLGMAYAYSNQYELAVAYLTKAIHLTESYSSSIKENKLHSLANVYLSLSQLHATLGNFSISKDFAFQSIDIYKKIKDAYGQAQALQQIAWLQIEVGTYRDAEKNLNKSIEYYNKMHLFTFEQYLTISDIAEKENRYEDALRYRLYALAKADSANILPQTIWTTIRVGDAYKMLGAKDKAREFYLRAMKFNKELNHSNLTPAIDYRVGNVHDAIQSFQYNRIWYGHAITAVKIGEMYHKESPDSAFYYYEQALTLFQEFENQEYSNLAKLHIADLLIQQQKSNEAIALLIPINKNTKNQEIKWQSYYLNGKTYENLRNDSSAIDCYKKSIDVIESIRGTIIMEEFRDSYLSDRLVVYDDLIELLQKIGMSEMAWYYSEKARARSFLDMIEGQKIGVSNAADSSLIKKEQILRSEISYLLKTTNMDNPVRDSTRAILPVIDSRLRQKEAEYHEVLEQLKLFKSKYIQLISASTIDLKQFQHRIKDGHTIIQYWCGTNYLKIDIIEKDTFISRTVDIQNHVLKNKIELCRRAMNQSEEMSKVYLRDLYEILWKPFEHEVPPSATVSIIPHQYLHNVPFAALYNGSYLVEKYTISNSVSATLYNDLFAKFADDIFLGIALRESNIGNHPPLLNTQEEVKQIKQYFSKSIIPIDDHINESFVKESLPNASVIHFATHGYYDRQQPLNSYLLLNADDYNDGLLTVHEIYNSNIQAKLSTLSACETGIGELSKGDELVSLSRAFLYAGSSNVISSLWNISDKSTPVLMNDLYSYFNQGHPVLDALSMAQRNFIKTKSSDPKLWSAFVLYN